MKKLIILSVILSFIFGLFALSANAAKPSDYGLKEGDLISAIFSDDPDVYIINDSGYKRLFLNPAIFKFYSHLGGFVNVKLVPTEVRDAFITSGLFRNCEFNDPKVYGVDIDGEDTGKLHWVNVSAENATFEDEEFFKKVFCINNSEFGWYPKGSEFKAVKDVPKYERMKEKEKLSTQEKIAEKAEIKNIGQIIICHYPPGNPAAYETITVGTPALKAHLDHGDTVGTCPTVPAQDKIAPVISGINVTNITHNSATIVWSTNESSDSQVQYGLTVNYTNSTALNTSMVASHLVVLSDLSPFTIYHYRVKSKDATGNLTVSEDHTFTTNALSTDTTSPSVPTDLVAVAISSSQIYLSWTASTDNVGVTGYRIYRGDVQINNSTLNSYSDTGLSPSTTYSHTIAAYDAAGNVSGQSNSASAITRTSVSQDTTPPSTPTNLTATVISSSQINLAWTTSTDNVGVAGYRIYRGGNQVATSTTNSYSNTGLSPSTIYSYTIAAYDAAGNLSNQSPQALATTQAAEPVDTTPPVLSGGAPTGTLIFGTFRATLSLITNESATCKYSITSGVSYASMANKLYTANGTIHSAPIINLQNDKSYNYYIKCKDSANNANASDYIISFSIAASTSTTKALFYVYPRPGFGRMPVQCVYTNSTTTVRYGEASALTIVDGVIQNGSTGSMNRCDGIESAVEPNVTFASNTTYKIQAFQSGLPITDIYTFTTWSSANAPVFNITFPVLYKDAVRIEYKVDACSDSGAYIYYGTDRTSVENLTSAKAKVNTFIDSEGYHRFSHRFDPSADTTPFPGGLITGLTPGTTYYVKAVQNSSGIGFTESGIVTFTTPSE